MQPLNFMKLIDKSNSELQEILEKRKKKFNKIKIKHKNELDINNEVVLEVKEPVQVVEYIKEEKKEDAVVNAKEGKKLNNKVKVNGDVIKPYNERMKGGFFKKRLRR